MFICFIWFFSLECEYGDRASGCYSLNCLANPSVCCGTCYSAPTLTRLPQEPTTKYNNPCKTTVITTTLATTLTTQTSFVFRLTITLLIDITDDLSDDAAKESVRSKVQAAVCMFPII